MKTTLTAKNVKSIKNIISRHKEMGDSKSDIKWRIKLGYPTIADKEFNKFYNSK